MKKLILILITSLVSLTANAEIVIPTELVDAVITVILKDSKVYTFSANKYKIVKREDAKENEQEQVVNTTTQSSQKKNRFKLLGGAGPTDISATRTSSGARVSSETGAVGGASYDRMLDESWSVGGQVLTNGTYMLGVGYDW